MSTRTSSKITFSDGVEHEISVDYGQSMLEAALAADVPVLYQCGTGSCGSCVAHLDEGEASHIAGSISSLLPSERSQGFRLLCITDPKDGCRFSVSYDSAVGAVQPTQVKCFINAIDRIAFDVVRLVLELAEGYWLDFRPGQFVQLNVPGSSVLRSYSIASTVEDLPRIELLIRLLPNGIMSDWLTNCAKVDDVIDVSGPFGQFFLKEKVRGTHVMIAGGTGLAPMMSMIDALRATPGKKPKVILSFGCQTTDGLFNLDQIELRKHWLPSLEVRVSVDRGQSNENIRTGNPVSALTDMDGLAPDSVAYLCGPPGMIDSAKQHLEALGLLPENIFSEQFVASS